MSVLVELGLNNIIEPAHNTGKSHIELSMQAFFLIGKPSLYKGYSTLHTSKSLIDRMKFIRREPSKFINFLM